MVAKDTNIYSYASVESDEDGEEWAADEKIRPLATPEGLEQIE
ncbi:hypothetical protein RB195_014221 [Necator americanus]|uniref:Uncharacterized protein n=1 Tax=Necator americanus TaxID=51031 RepID=A0ABR1DZ37_NECAM